MKDAKLANGKCMVLGTGVEIHTGMVAEVATATTCVENVTRQDVPNCCNMHQI